MGVGQWGSSDGILGMKWCTESGSNWVGATHVSSAEPRWCSVARLKLAVFSRYIEMASELDVP